MESAKVITRFLKPQRKSRIHYDNGVYYYIDIDSLFNSLNGYNFDLDAFCTTRDFCGCAPHGFEDGFDTYAGQADYFWPNLIRLESDDVDFGFFCPSNKLNSGLKKFDGKDVYIIDYIPTIIDYIYKNYAVGQIVNEDFTTTPCYIAIVDGHYAHGVTLHKAVEDAKRKALRAMPVKERVSLFKATFPLLKDSATCETLAYWHHVLTGACEMGQKRFIKEHNLRMKRKYSIKYFLDITSNEEYGYRIMLELKELYESDAKNNKK